mmetsp:Transcript_38436/g.99292  ORF Transcript_38436/g.99292 Transcript_38436/m.99292 type:complete len:733 (-) Transcript_38436:36-2234(-)
MSLKCRYQRVHHRRHVGLEQVRHASHRVLQQPAALLHHLRVPGVLRDRLPYQRPEGVGDDRATDDRLRRAVHDVNLSDDRREPVQDLAKHLRLFSLGGEAVDQRRHHLLQASSERLVLSQTSNHAGDALHNEEVHPYRQRHGGDVELRELWHQLLEVLLPADADVLEGNGRGLLRLLHALQDVCRSTLRRLLHEDLRDHLQGYLQELGARPEPLGQKAQELDRGLLREVQNGTLRRVPLDRLRDERWQALDQRPQHALFSHLCLRRHTREDEEVCLLDWHTLRLPVLQALQHMLQCTVGRQDLKAILSQAEEAVAAGQLHLTHLLSGAPAKVITFPLERVLVRWHCASPDHDAKQLHVDTLELVNLRVRLRMPAHLVGKPVPELQRDEADLLHRQVCALEDHPQDGQHFRVCALLHDQRHETLSCLNVDPADLEDPILIRVQRCLDAAAQQRLQLLSQSAEVWHDHLDDRLEERQIEAAHPQDLRQDIRRRLCKLPALHDHFEALGNERVLCDDIRLQICELDPAQETLQHLLLGLQRGALQRQQELDDLRSSLLKSIPTGPTLVRVSHQLVVHILLWQHAQYFEQSGVAIGTSSESLKQQLDHVRPSRIHLDGKVSHSNGQHRVDGLELHRVWRHPKLVNVVEQRIPQTREALARQLIKIKLDLGPQGLRREEAVLRGKLRRTEDLVGYLPRSRSLLELREPLICLLLGGWVRRTVQRSQGLQRLAFRVHA